MHSSVHSASSHTGSVQIYFVLDVKCREFRFHPIVDDTNSSTGSCF